MLALLVDKWAVKTAIEGPMPDWALLPRAPAGLSVLRGRTRLDIAV
jgi:hypothetical protein